jgi:Alginate lyase
MRPLRRPAYAHLLILLASLCAACSVSTVTGTPFPAASSATSSAPSAGSVSLSGWQLTLPLAGKNGAAAIVKPAAASPPWLTTEGSGGLTFFAPVNGAKTKNSDHARTELVGLDTFTAGSGHHVLHASIAVSQVPAAARDVIVGQIHGAGTIKSVPFVMLHYDAGAITVVVKQQQSGAAAQRLNLLSDVALAARFDYSLTDNGDGSLTFTADEGSRHASLNARLPDAFRGASVRFQAGAYQQGHSGHGAGAEDGARLTFFALNHLG